MTTSILAAAILFLSFGGWLFVYSAVLLNARLDGRKKGNQKKKQDHRSC